MDFDKGVGLFFDMQLLHIKMHILRVWVSKSSSQSDGRQRNKCYAVSLRYIQQYKSMAIQLSITTLIYKFTFSALKLWMYDRLLIINV
jgi:hypothetical protein